MDFINTYNDAEILIDAANHLANVLRHSPAYPGALHPFTISIDGVNVDDENAAREAFFAFLCSILNRWYYDAAPEAPSLQIRVSVLRNNLFTILLDAPRGGVVVYWHNGEYVVNPDAARESGLKRYNAPYLILDANALEVETGKDE
jgi:hypothetical protein